MSGLEIFNAHPALYWGQSGADVDRPLFEIEADDSGDGPPAGFAWIGSSTFIEAMSGRLGMNKGRLTSVHLTRGQQRIRA
jgi:hypothetical protein